MDKTTDKLRARVTHELKTWPEFFQATLDGHKCFELRRDDRPEGFQVGDHLREKEWDPEIYESYGPGEGGKHKGYTGRELLVRVDYIMDAKRVDRFMGFVESHDPRFGPGMVIMSISRVH